jgi:hypothetical protein
MDGEAHAQHYDRSTGVILPRSRPKHARRGQNPDYRIGRRTALLRRKKGAVLMA